MTEINLLEEEF